MRSIVLVLYNLVLLIMYLDKIKFFCKMVGWLGRLLIVLCIVSMLSKLFLNYVGFVSIEMMEVLVRVYLSVCWGVEVVGVILFLEGEVCLILVMMVVWGVEIIWFLKLIRGGEV